MRRTLIGCSIALIMLVSSLYYVSNFAFGSYLFQDGFESGDPSNWTKISKDSSAVSQVTNSISKEGTYSLRVSTAVANSWSYIYKTLTTGQASFYLSWSMYFTSIPSRDSARLYFVRMKNSADQSLVSLDLNWYNSTGLRQRLLMYQPNISNEVVSTLTTGQWYWFQINYTIGSVGGGADFWINGVKANSVLNVKNAGLGHPVTAQVGVCWGSGDTFGACVDSCVIDSSYVNAGTTPPPPPTPSTSASLDEDRYIVWCYNRTHYAAINMTSSLVECISTNASAVINNAIGNLSYPWPGGGIVHIMAGLYSLTAPINMRGRLTLEGDGPESTVLRVAPGSNCSALQFTGPKSENEFFMVIRDLQLHGEPNDTLGTGILLDSTGHGMADWVLENVFIQRFPVDDLYFNSYNGWAAKIVTCTFEHAGRFAIYKSDGEDERIIGNKFLYNTNGIYLGERHGTLAVVSNNFFYENTGFGIWINGPSNVISGNTFFENSVDNNNSSDDIYLQTGSGNQITGNVFAGGTDVRHAVNIDSSAVGNSVTGNTFNSTFNSGPIHNSGTGNLITDNVGFVTENSGSTTSCLNGTWIPHGLAGAPNGQRQLMVDGSRIVNSTCYLLDPTVIAKNSTQVQIEFLYSNNSTLAPVSYTEAKTILWYFEYKP